MSPDEVVASLRSAGCVFAEKEAGLMLAQATSAEDLAQMVERRRAGEPLEQILAWVEFCGHRVALDAGVFVPRQRSRLLVKAAASLAATACQGRGRPVVVDLCCGSGAIGLSVVASMAGADLVASDLDPAAVACARRNVAAVGGEVYTGDLFDALPVRLQGRVDLLLASPPYVPTDSLRLLPREAREHEPRTALDGGWDGLDVTRRIAAGARPWLAPGGHLLVELGRIQGAAGAALLSDQGYATSVAVSEDDEGTVVVARAVDQASAI